MLGPALALILIAQAPAPAPPPARPPARPPEGAARLSVNDEVLVEPTTAAADFEALDELALLIASVGAQSVATSPRYAELRRDGRVFELTEPTRLVIHEVRANLRFRDESGRPIPVYAGPILDGAMSGRRAAVFASQIRPAGPAGEDEGGRPGASGGASGGASAEAEVKRPSVEERAVEARYLAKLRTIYKESRRLEAIAAGRAKAAAPADRPRVQAEESRSWRAEVIRRYYLGTEQELDSILDNGRAVEEAEALAHQQHAAARRMAKQRVGLQLGEIAARIDAQLAVVLKQAAREEQLRISRTFEAARQAQVEIPLAAGRFYPGSPWSTWKPVGSISTR